MSAREPPKLETCMSDTAPSIAVAAGKEASHRSMSRPSSSSRFKLSSKPTSGDSRKNCKRLGLADQLSYARRKSSTPSLPRRVMSCGFSERARRKSCTCASQSELSEILGGSNAASLAVGYYRDTGDPRSNWDLDRTWTPNMNEETREGLYKTWKEAGTRCFDWIK